MTPQDVDEIDNLIENALKEDLGRGDITSTLVIDDSAEIPFTIIAKQDLIICGVEIVHRLIRRMPRKISASAKVKDGDKLKKGDVILKGSGHARSILALERVALNILQHLSGISTLTNEFATAVKGTNAKILDTRKTIPGMRMLQKYAVHIGGGYNHRLRLDDGIMIKDNHIAIAGGVKNAVERAKSFKNLGDRKIEVECDDLTQVKQAISAGADIILLDNMSLKDMKEAVNMVKGKIPLEASGNINLKRVSSVAKTGVDFISVGQLTHSSPSADISLDIK